LAVVALTTGAGVFTYRALATNPATAEGQVAAADDTAKEIKFETIAKSNFGGPRQAEQKVVKTQKDWDATWKLYHNNGLVRVPPMPVPPMPAPGVNPPKVVPAPGNVPMKVAPVPNPAAPAPAPGNNVPMKVAPAPAPAPAGGAGGIAPGAAPGAAQAQPNALIARPKMMEQPKVDFDKQIVVAVALGSGGAGRSIEITKIEQTKDGVKVFYKEQQPDRTKVRPAIAMANGPYHMVKLDKPTGDIKFVKEEAKEGGK
jgi:hypothetical protein